MFWICENENQLEKISYNKPCYINVIPLNHNYHPTLTGVSLIYYKVFGKKGIIFPINHNDGFSLEMSSVLNLLLKHPSIYCLNKKKILHYFGDKFNINSVIDINLLHLEVNTTPLQIPNYKSIVSNYIEGGFKTHNHLNSFIPITKHYEESEKIYKDIKKYIGLIPQNEYYNGVYTEVLWRIEKNGININEENFHDHFNIKYPQLSIKDNKIFTQYNLYNFTSRPSNAFNGINFAALKKSDNTREFIKINDGHLFEYDYDGYHYRLIGHLVNYSFSEESIHTQMGRIYFNKPEITQEEYKESKQISFRQVYGNVYKQYEHIEFFQKVKKYIQKLWDFTNEHGYLELIGGRRISLDQIVDPNPSKIFNYLVVSMETYYNIISIKKVLDFLDTQESSCILYTYDSILINYSQDDKEILKTIKSLLEDEGFKINVSYGKDYNNLKNI